MPMQLIVHAPNCATKKSPCSCSYQTFTDATAALAAHGGDFKRLEILSITPPAEQRFWAPEIPPERSQARRHGREISY